MLITARNGAFRPKTKSRIAAALSLFVAVDLLAFLVALLRLHRERRDGPGLEALQRDWLAGVLAIAVGVVLDTLERGVDLGDQLALAVAGAEFDGTVGFGRCPIGEIGVVHVLLLQSLQRELGLFEDLILPGEELQTEVLLLPVVHERLFFGRSVVFQLFQGRPICLSNDSHTERGPLSRAYIATPCDRQYFPAHL